MITTISKYQRIIALFLLELFLAQTVLAGKVHSGNYVPSMHRPAYAVSGSGLPESAAGFMQEASPEAVVSGEAAAMNVAEQQLDWQPEVGGPGQPEMSSFKSVNSNNMVDMFTGDFSYNIPLLDVGGYPVNIHYNSGISMDQEASWVGLGWNINPGVIGRTTRGLPDDFNGLDSIVRTQSIKENKTVGATISANPEVKGRPLPIEVGIGAFHNNYNGWGTESFVNVSINAGKNAKGNLSGSLSVNNNSQTGLNVQPSLAMRLGKKDSEWNGAATIGTNYNSRSGISALQLNTEVRRSVSMTATARDAEGNALEMRVSESIGMGMPSSISFATPSYLPTVTMPMTNSQFSFKLKVGAENWIFFSNASILGYVSRSYIKEADKRQVLPAYGYLHFSKGRSGRSLLDFNREKEVAFNAKSTPHIALPQYTYDVYSISGEGISGSFRPYRGDVGYIHDHSVTTKSENSRISAELGFAQYFHGGVDFDHTTSVTQTGAWVQNNDILRNLKFQASDSTFEEVYFRNPGEKGMNTSAFYTKLGGDSLVNVRLTGSGAGVKAESVLSKYSSTLAPTGVVNVNTPVYRDKRDKRSQVISYLKAGEAVTVGMDTVIRSFRENSNPLLSCNNVDTIRRVGGIRKEHHISEINVLNPDGRRYVYGLPAYNISQEDVVFSVNPGTDPADAAKGLAAYASGDNSPNNTKGKDNFYTRDSTPAHAHSFLLTGIVSPDYVDVKGDGITEDDLGDGVRFNYTQVYGGLNNNPFKWRTPSNANRGTYNEGLKTYNRDDKATYLYGSKEVWYLNSIESKTMIALFKVSNRTDIYSVNGENGGYNTGSPMKKLDSIELYSKADIIKNGTAAKPMKTVHFEYETSPDGQLCKGVANDPNKGKLTLKKIWFTYNKNNKGQKNPYVFYYNPGTDNNPKPASNPSYNPKAYDRWGNYKDQQANPGGLSNLDYPYAVQDSAEAAKNISVWHLTDIKLPSGARLHVTYESDDYGFVQDKRAVNMFGVEGFGASVSATPSNKLYTSVSSDNHYLFVNSARPLADKKDVYRNFLQGLEDRDGKLRIYFKVAVRMPYGNDAWSTPAKYEMVPGYAEVEDYGVTGSNRVWLRLKSVDGSGVLAKTALQFLRLNLPSKAYPASEIGDDVSPGQVVKTLASGFQEIKNSVDGFDDQQKRKFHCQVVELDKSFVRLGNPRYKKYGGGIRVKRIEVADNWNAMTGQKESVYGQEYSYTTSYVRGFNDTISISSGVAAYEPMVGGEENPFRLPVEYTEKLAPLAPSNFLYTETPLGESFFPSPMVGYSKVRVRTINAKAKSANGWTETEFYTTRDFPTRVDNTSIDKRSHNPKYNILKVNAIHHLTVSQGFRIELNDMNGKVKAESIYAENDSLRPIHYTANFYKVENDLSFSKRLSNTVWAVDSISGHINKKAEIGKEVEVMVDVREQKSTTLSGNLGVNVDITPFPFIPGFLILPSGIPLPQREESRFRSIAVTKVVNRYGILDSVVVMDKGSILSTKNLVFDAETGQPLVTRVNNEFNDPVYSFSYPARWAYSGMGMAYENEGLLLSNKKIKSGRLVEQDETASPAEKYFESGDEIWLVSATKAIVTPNTSTSCGIVMSTGVKENKRKKIWAVDASKGKEGHRGIYFIDENGKPYTGIVEKMRIIRSGKRNLSDAFVGSVTMMTNPVKDLSATEGRIVVDNNSKVINASAGTYSDLWKVENTLYEKDSCYTKIAVKTVTLYSSQSMLMQEYQKGGGNPQHIQRNVMNSPYYSASLKNYPNCSGTIEISCRKTRTYRSKSILKFDFSLIPSDATIQTASLDLYPKRVSGLWSGSGINEINQYLADKTNAHYVRDGDAASRTNASVLRRVKNTWNTSTPYANISTYPESVPISAAPDNSCDMRTGLLVKDLVQPLIGKPWNNYGFLVQLQNDGHGNNKDYQFRAMTFCTGGENYNNTLTSAYKLEGETVPSAAAPMAAPSCSNCYSPTLTVTYTYSKDTCVKICRNNITDTTNPYRWGILGNWRTDQTIIYYADRNETDASATQTDVRKEGFLKDFLPYWSFTSGSMKATSDTGRWVWNTAPGQYNRKGVETENFDPLGRYNAGLYAYNQNLPVAVAQNSKYREILFDGFEDYHYRTRNCDTACAVPKEIDFIKGNPAASIYGQESHTGMSSVMIAQNGQAVFSAPVTSPAADAMKPTLSVRVDSTPIFITTVVGKGKGLNATYTCSNGTSLVQRREGPLDIVYNTYAQSLPANCSNLRYRATWRGKIQPKFSENYTFYMSTPLAIINSSGAGLTIIDPATNTAVATIAENVYGGTRTVTTAQPLVAGKLYDVTVTYPIFRKNTGEIHFSWSSNRQQYEIVPQASLYPSDMLPADSAGSVIRTIKEYCVNTNGVVQTGVILPKFSPLAGKRMVVTAWAKVPSWCDNSVVTAPGQLTVSFNTGLTANLVKTGLPVEGWQRYEADVTIPSTATQVYLTLKAGASPLLVDDIRVQPYNSNMRSFVYDPVSLRLMSELDENNYASLFEYDDDGTLVRTKKETEKGIQTLKETRTSLGKQ
jgi:hypothetical protein